MTATCCGVALENHFNCHRSGFSNALISLYKTLIEQLDRKDEQIVNLQKIIYNKDTRLLELTDKNLGVSFGNESVPQILAIFKKLEVYSLQVIKESRLKL